MYAIANLVRRCPTCPDVIKEMSDGQITEMLNTYVDNGLQLADILIDIGCEVVVEELLLMLHGGTFESGDYRV